MTQAEAKVILLEVWRGYRRKKWLREVSHHQMRAIPFCSARAPGWALMVDFRFYRVTRQNARVVKYRSPRLRKIRIMPPKRGVMTSRPFVVSVRLPIRGGSAYPCQTRSMRSGAPGAWIGSCWTQTHDLC